MQSLTCLQPIRTTGIIFLLIADVDEEFGLFVHGPAVLAAENVEVHQGRIGGQVATTAHGPFGCNAFGMFGGELALGMS